MEKKKRMTWKPDLSFKIMAKGWFTQEHGVGMVRSMKNLQPLRSAEIANTLVTIC